MQMARRGTAAGMQVGRRGCPIAPAPSTYKPVLRVAGEAGEKYGEEENLPVLGRAGWARRGVACKPPATAKS